MRIYVLVLSFLATTLFAQPQPSERLGDLKHFAGDWRCTGKAFASAFGPEHPTTAKIRVTWVRGRYWLFADYAETKTAQNPNPAAGHVHWGYDERTKKFTGYAVNNFGGHSTIESDGWHGDTIVWTGTTSVGEMTFKTRDTFIRPSARVVVHSTEAEIQGRWVTLDEETCRKTS